MQLRQMTEEFSDYLRDESRTVGQADTISFPKTVQEVAEIVRYCYEHNIFVDIQGARTGLAGGASLAGGNIVNFSRMNRILGLRYDEKQDQYYLRIQPGVLLLQVRKALENKSFVIKDWDAASIDALKRIEPGQLFFAPDPTEPKQMHQGIFLS